MGTGRLQPWMSLEPELFESLGDFHPTPKMDDLKPVSHREFKEFITGKEFKGRKDYALRDKRPSSVLSPWSKKEC